MIQNHLLDMQRLLRERGILISFSGRLSQQLIEEYGAAVKTYLETDNRAKNEVHHAFSIFIEQTQNIKNYCQRKASSPEYERISQSSIVTLGRDEDGIYICSGNLVENGDLAPLVSHVQSLLPLDKDALKLRYKEQLKRDLPEGAGGAGIGIIDMARKAKAPLEFDVTPVDGSVSFFTLKAVV